MGPSIFIDGEMPPPPRLGAGTAASMGPSIFIDGEERLASSSPSDRLALQWGRRSSSTESSLTASPPAPGWNALQWGRRSSSTESNHQWGEWCRRHKASMGPSIFIDGETPSQPPPPPQGGTRFNGAVDLHRRRAAFCEAN